MRTFVFTDIEGSTDLWERAPDEMKRALERHDALVRAAVDERGGRIFATGGDGVAAVFTRADDAVRAAVALQARLGAEQWATPTPIRVRVGVHSGHADERDRDFFGPTLNRTARLMSIAHGGQVVCSGATAALLDGAPPAPLVDLGQHRLRDLSAPVSVFQVGDGSFPPLRSLDSVPSNLPTMLTELVGRHDDVVSLVGEVRSHRLLTLTGVGGVGKTRLSLAVGGAVAPDFPDGCWLAELAPVADGCDVVRTVAAALGASSVDMNDASALVRYLEHRRLVLVLDNCEHVLDDVADLVDGILSTASDVHVVTTSREPLGLDGEIVRRVRSLDDAPALSLFVERARAVDDAFTLTDDNTDAVADICARLDGIPLAIELAAARVVAMSPAEIARRLDDRFRVLTGGRRAQERHRTLQATVGWSYDLLSQDDRRVFARLSVFPATFDLAAALAIADTDDVDAIVRLVQRSLVVHDQTAGRYRLLETLRQYGADRLVELGEADATRERYAAHYLDVAMQHGPGAEDHRCERAIAVLFVELENIRSTAEWLIREKRWAELRQLVLKAKLLFTEFAVGELAGWLDAALAEGGGDIRERVDLLGMAAMNAGSAQRFDASFRYGEESLRLASMHGVPESVWAHHGLSLATLMGGGDPGTALHHAQRMAALSDDIGDAFSATTACALMMMPLTLLGRPRDVDVVIDDALQRAEALGNASAMSIVVIAAAANLLDRNTEHDRQRVRDLLAKHDSDARRAYGGLLMAWLLAWRSAAFDDMPRQAAGDAIDAARCADRVGSPLALFTALDALIAPCARLGLADETRQLSAYLEANGQLVDAAFGRRYFDGARARALATLGPPRDGDSLAGPKDRKELFELLARVERAIA